MSKQVSNKDYSKIQLWILVLLRLVIGYHFLFEGFNKLLNPIWSSMGFLYQSYGVFLWIANSPTILGIVDFINIWGQILIGFSLLVGLFSRYAAWAGAFLLLLYYLALPPTALGNLFIDRNLMELFGLLVIALFSTSSIVGMDGLIQKFRSNKHA